MYLSNLSVFLNGVLLIDRGEPSSRSSTPLSPALEWVFFISHIVVAEGNGDKYKRVRSRSPSLGGEFRRTSQGIEYQYPHYVVDYIFQQRRNHMNCIRPYVQIMHDAIDRPMT